MSSVREILRAMQAEVIRDNLDPQRAAHMLNSLCALLGNCNKEIRESDQVFANVLLALLKSHEKANRAKIEAETTPAYQRKVEARHIKDEADALIGSLKYFLRAAESEMRNLGR